ncbi:30S ribosomal protein S13 [Candidatus Uhrbacteria bacterium]|nr:30S ribosomal protein S13 [Candidatus Uhrbacteria bacterium]
MARIAGITLPNQKGISIALTSIYGIGPSIAKHILNQVDVPAGIRTKDLTEEQVNKIREIVEKQHRVEGDLRREVMGNVKRLKDIGSYRGIRHIRRLPTHGQRTKTNSRTVRGNVRKTTGSGKRTLTKT